MKTIWGCKMKPLVTKAEILSWYENAKKVLNLRRYGQHPRGRVSDKDFEAYTWSIESHFKMLKRKFNERLKNAAPNKDADSRAAGTK